MPALKPTVAIVLLNWNGWQDTIECLESVFRSDYDNFFVVVCDNASRDLSVSELCSWGQSRTPALVASFSRPSAVKPVAAAISPQASPRGVVLIQNPRNYG